MAPKLELGRNGSLGWCWGLFWVGTDAHQMDEQNEEGNEGKMQDAGRRKAVERERGREGRKKEAEDLAVDDNWEHCRLTIW